MLWDRNTTIQDNWTILFLIIQLVLNNKLSNNTEEFSYYVNYGKHAKQRKKLFIKKPSETSQQKAEKTKKT